MEQEHVWMSFLYFITVVGGLVLITKYICTALAAKYKMEAEKYKYEKKQIIMREGIINLFL